MKLLIISLLIGSLYGANLKSIIDATIGNNGNIKAKEYEALANGAELASLSASSMPTVDIVAELSKNSPKGAFTPGESATLSILLNYKIYDSGKRANLTRAKKLEQRATNFEKRAIERSLSLKAIKLYYNYFKAVANLKAISSRDSALKAQLNRLKKLKSVGLVTSEEVSRIKSAIEQNRYAKESIKFAMQSTLERLKLLSHKKIKFLKLNYFKNPNRVAFSPLFNIKKIRALANSLNYNQKAVESAYKPQVGLKYRYSKSKFADTAPSPFGKLPEHNSKLSIQASMRLYDGGTIKQKGEALKYKRLSLLSLANELLREQKMNLKLSKIELRSIRAKIKSAKSAYLSAKESYKRVKKEYEAGLIEYVTYLDALTQKAVTFGQYKEAIYDLEVAKASIFYYSGANLKGAIRWKV